MSTPRLWSCAAVFQNNEWSVRGIVSVRAEVKDAHRSSVPHTPLALLRRNKGSLAATLIAMKSNCIPHRQVTWSYSGSAGGHRIYPHAASWQAYHTQH